LESTKEKLGEACNYIDFLDKEIIELKESNDTLNEELNTKKKNRLIILGWGWKD